MPREMIGFAALAITFVLPFAAQAQDSGAYSISPMPRVDRVSWEVGQDVYAGGRTGELGLYFGVTQGNNLLAFRAGILEESKAVPCSLGVMYQHIAFANTALRVKPTASIALGRVFSCAATGDPRRSSPDVNGTATLGGGVRIAMFNGAHVAGSLDVMGYVGRMNGVTPRTDRSTSGVMLGIAIHGARQ
jgi:hypothetical protein